MLISEAMDLLDKSMIKLANNLTARGQYADANIHSISEMADMVMYIKDGPQKLVIIDEDTDHNPLTGGRFGVVFVGEFHTVDGVAVTGHIEPGNYIVVKANKDAFPDYTPLSGDEPVKFEIKEGMTTVLRFQSFKVKPTVIEFTHTAHGTDKPVYGGEVAITDSTGGVVDRVKLDVNGKGNSKPLPVGQYKINWAVPAPGYHNTVFSMPDLPIDGYDERIPLRIYSEPDPAYKWGKIKVFLNGNNGAFPAGGAQIDVINASGYVVETLTTTSNKFNGVATSSYLPQGKYTVKLVKDAPGSDSSSIPDRAKTAEVTIDGTSEIVNAYLRTFKQLPLIVRITYAEANPEWGINAGDLITSDYAEFTVTDGTGAAVDYLSTDGGSAYGCKLLSAGDYTITAVQTPWGMLTPDPVTLSISGMDTSAEITIPFHFDPASAASERRAK